MPAVLSERIWLDSRICSGYACDLKVNESFLRQRVAHVTDPTVVDCLADLAVKTGVTDLGVGQQIDDCNE